MAETKDESRTISEFALSREHERKPHSKAFERADACDAVSVCVRSMPFKRPFTVAGFAYGLVPLN
jgi:hypothetical protein